MWAAALFGAVLLEGADDADFERFLGDTPPAVAVGVAGLVGAASLYVLDSSGWVGRGSKRRGFARAGASAIGFGAAILVADVALGFGADINVAWPTSVLFYPVMAFIAEVAFHLAPLALLVTILRRQPGVDLGGVSGLLVVALVAAVEAVYQMIGTEFVGGSGMLAAYLALHMMVFGIVGMTALRRYGFGSMMWFRLLYYLIWHIMWGPLRLDLLF